ncbi:MAG TPA: tyrosine-type recombinase/integrase [Gemmataceae bacterium]|jgi:integrase|nr:tyrosine-type recombinase/integrase [Gemmataceae bacterium]
MSFRKLADLFIDVSLRTKKLNTYRLHKYLLQSFCDHIGKRRVSDLKVLHVTEWLGKQKWNQSTACSARSALLACLNWGVNEGRIDRHPMTKLKRGTHKRRERIFTIEERERIRKQVRPDFRDFLFALEQTGTRPFSERATITASMVDWATNTITLKEHKNDGKGTSRTIYLTPAMVELLKKLSESNPIGLLFRNSRDGIWTSHDATRRLHYATDKLGIPRGSLYAYRHAMINDSLAKGMTADGIAELVGNSAITIARHYSHLSQKREAMLEAAKRAVA